MAKQIIAKQNIYFAFGIHPILGSTTFYSGLSDRRFFRKAAKLMLSRNTPLKGKRIHCLIEGMAYSPDVLACSEVHAGASGNSNDFLWLVDENLKKRKTTIKEIAEDRDTTIRKALLDITIGFNRHNSQIILDDDLLNFAMIAGNTWGFEETFHNAVNNGAEILVGMEEMTPEIIGKFLEYQMEINRFLKIFGIFENRIDDVVIAPCELLNVMINNLNKVSNVNNTIEQLAVATRAWLKFNFSRDQTVTTQVKEISRHLGMGEMLFIPRGRMHGFMRHFFQDIQEQVFISTLNSTKSKQIERELGFMWDLMDEAYKTGNPERPDYELYAKRMWAMVTYLNQIDIDKFPAQNFLEIFFKEQLMERIFYEAKIHALRTVG